MRLLLLNSGLNGMEPGLSIVDIFEVLLVCADGCSTHSSLIPLQARNSLIYHLRLFFFLPILLDFVMRIATFLSLHLLFALNTKYLFFKFLLLFF